MKDIEFTSRLIKNKRNGQYNISIPKKQVPEIVGDKPCKAKFKLTELLFDG